MAGEFLSNPFVSAVGSALGLDPLFNGSSDSSQVATPPQPLKSQVAKPPVADNRVESTRDSMAVRQHYPSAQATRGLGPGKGAAVPGMGLPGVMSPDVLMHPAVQQLLNQYGVSPQQLQETVQGASPNLFITNPAAYQKHPVLAGMLERGLEGAAFTKGSRTIGEGISNVAQGMLDANGARAEKYNNQLMMPIAQAAQISGIKTAADDQRFKEAQAMRDDALSKHYADMDDWHQAATQIQQGHLNLLSQIERMKENIGLVNQAQKTPLNADEQKTLNDAIQEAHGDQYAVDPSVYRDVFSRAAQRMSDSKLKNARDVAAIAGNSRVTAANVGGGNKDNALELSALKADAANKAKEYSQFVGSLGRGVATVNGRQVFASDPEAQKEQGRLKAIMDAANHKVVQAGTDAAQRSLQLPGVVAPKTSPKVRQRTMNLDGTITEQ